MTDGTTGPAHFELLERSLAGIRCIEVLRQLSEYLDGELPEDVRTAFDRHIAVCTECEEFGARFTATIHTLRREMASAPPVDAVAAGRLRATVMAALEEVDRPE